MEMDSAVWEQLPDALIERVLTLLPLPSLLQLRAVSKAWSSLILSQGFINLCSEAPHKPPHFVFLTAACDYGVPTVAAFSPASSHWQALSFDFLHGQGEGGSAVLASAGGLLCLSPIVGGHIVVCNPLTRCWRELPGLTPSSSEAPLMPLLTGMLVDPTSKSYKILVAGPNGCHDQRTCLYDAGTGEWSFKGDLPQGVLGFESDPIVCGGSFYAVACLPYRLLAFDFSRGEWSKIQMPLPCGALNPHLVLCSGILLLVAAFDEMWQEGSEDAAPESIRIWRIHPASGEWELLESMPSDMCAGFLKGDGFDSYKCIGREDLLYFSSYDGAFMSCFDLPRMAWQWLPHCKDITKSRCFVEGMFVVEPALDISV